MTFADYRAIKAMNWSTLKHGLRSMLALHHAMTTTDSDDTASRQLLRAAHLTVLEPDSYDANVVVYPGAVRRGKEWETFKAEHADRTILNQTEFVQRQADHEKLLRIRDAVMSNPDVARLINGAKTEQTIQWTDPATGVPCKGRLDVLGPDYIADLKGDASVEDRVFARRVGQLCYYGQAAWYQAGVEVRTGRTLPFYAIVYEAKAPHDSAVYEMDKDWLNPGRDLCARLLEQYAACVASGVWPRRYSGVQALPTPPPHINPDVDDDFEIVE